MRRITAKSAHVTSVMKYWSRCLIGGVVLFFLLSMTAKAQSHSQALSSGAPNLSVSDQAAAEDPLRTCVPPERQSAGAKLYQERLEEYLQARNESPRNAEVEYNLGILFARLQHWEEAEKSFFQALSFEREKERVARIYHQLGNVYACQRQFENAIAQYKETLRMEPQDADTQHNLALIQLLAQQQQQQQRQQRQQQPRGNSDDNHEQTDSQQSPGASEQQLESDPDRPPTETSPEEENSNQNTQEVSRQESNPQKDQHSDSDDSPQEQSLATAEGNGEEEEQDAMQAALTRQQAEQLLNSISEDRRQFIQRLLNRQKQIPPANDKSW